MIRRPPRSTQSRSSAASDVYKRQLYPQRWYLGTVVEMKMRRVQAAGGDHTFFAPDWHHVGCQHPVKMDLDDPHLAVSWTWGDKFARQYRQSAEAKSPQKQERRRRGSSASVEAAGSNIFKNYVCWIAPDVNLGHYPNRFLLADGEGEAWIVRRLRFSHDAEVWEEGEIVKVRLVLMTHKKTGDRWMQPDWKALGATAAPTALSPLHQRLVSEFFQCDGE